VLSDRPCFGTQEQKHKTQEQGKTIMQEHNVQSAWKNNEKCAWIGKHRTEFNGGSEQITYDPPRSHGDSERERDSK